MSSLLPDLVKIQVLSSGTGPFQLGAAATGFRGIEALVDGGSYSYSVQSGAQFEAGTCVWNAGSGLLIRTPLLSSNGNAAVAFGANVEVKFVALGQDLTPPGALPIVQSTGTGLDVAMSQNATTDNLNALDAAKAETNLSNVPAPLIYFTKDATWYGADPSFSAAANASAINAAFADGCTRLPPGDFFVTGDLTIPETLRADIEGAGSGRTRLIWTGNGGLLVPCKTGGDNYHVKNVYGMTLATQTVGSQTALRIYRTDTASIDTKINVEDVIAIGADGIYGSPTGPTQYWGTLLDMQAVRNIGLRSVTLKGGGAGKTANGWRVRTDNSDPQFFVTFDDLMIDGVTLGMDFEGWIEGIYGRGFSLVGTRDGIKYAHTGTTVGSIDLDAGDIFSSRCPINIQNAQVISIGEGLNAARGFVEPEYNAAFQDTGAVLVSGVGYHYVADCIDISSNGTEGKVKVNATCFSVFADTPNFISVIDVNTGSSNAICYGASVGAGLALKGTTSNFGWGILNVTATGGSIAYGVSCESTCSSIKPGFLVSTATTRLFDPGGVMGKSQAAFFAYSSGTQTDVTGDGTFYTVGLNTVAYNDGACFNTSTGKFTAPVSGYYEFGGKAEVGGIVTGHTSGTSFVATLAANYAKQQNVQNSQTGGFTSLDAPTVQIYLGSGQVASLLTVVNGGTKVVDILGGQGNTFLWGRLIREV